ncbi:GDSL esterase/lipase At5g22810-like [Hordeum vulgare subsp. vulgare]|uniref:GDSL esterase/lipase n=1 Tax=Hordeum vulgare subsp. vulgare TaxID=112509 RepID=A0A8I7BAQ8_HORVV|nr:GDSL esterase/lipase At5g22810-like [Hordeum vulgare subsp. vulgare]
MVMTNLVLMVIFLFVGPTTQGREALPLVPGVMLFGDSLVCIGNNNYITTWVKANMAPYGRDFMDHFATGRFSNGKVISDYIGEKLGFDGSPPAYLSAQSSGPNLLIGANFASAGSGYYDGTSPLYHDITLSQQVEYFKEYQSRLTVVAGRNQARTIISDALYIISAGSNDFGFNYYVNPSLFLRENIDQFTDRLIGIFNSTVMELYTLGARRIGVFSIAPLGCAPLAITVLGLGRSGCVPRLLDDARRFNRKLGAEVESLSKQYLDLKIALLDIYTPWHSLATSPGSYGFTEARHACCGTGLLEFTALFCNPMSIGTCENATTYVHWDAVHPSEAANKVIADSLDEGIKKLVM